MPRLPVRRAVHVRARDAEGEATGRRKLHLPFVTVVSPSHPLAKVRGAASAARIAKEVQLVLTDRVTNVIGQVTDARGAPATDGTIIVFAADAERWLDPSRFIRAGRPDQQGNFQARGLVPGEYLAAAIGYVEDGMWNDPEYLESIRRFAQKVTLGDGESRTIVLKLVNP